MPASVSDREIVATGLTFPEGPRWHGDALWFSDMHGHAVLRLVPGASPSVHADIPGCPSGLGFLPDGAPLVVSMHDRRLLRLTTEVPTLHADLSHLAPWHLNDMAVSATGRAYVGNFGDASAPPQPAVPTVLIAVEADGAARVVADDLHFPNGIAITRDGSTLIVAETRSLPGRLTAFTIDGRGDLSDRRTLARFGPGRLPDGIALDSEDRIWVALPFSEEVLRVTPDGVIDRRVAIESPYAVAVGGADGDELYVCSAPTWEPEAAARQRGGTISRLRIG